MAITEVDGRRRRGNASRQAILNRAVNLASVNGLDGVSIGDLAAEVGGSKSGVIALFGSKLDLQLATIASAREQFMATVIQRALKQPRGLPRLWRLVQLWLDYSEGRIFEGGCFFRAVAAESGSKDGPIHDSIAGIDAEWTAFLERAVELSRAELPRLVSVEQLAFELIAIMDGANSSSLLHRSSRFYTIASTAIRDRLIALGADPSVLTPRVAATAAPATG